MTAALITLWLLLSFAAAPLLGRWLGRGAR